MKTDPSPINQQIGQVIQNNLKPAGIDVKLEQEEFGTLLDDSTNGNFQALYLGWSGRIDPDLNIYDFMVTNGDFNDSGYSNPEVDKLNEARTTSDRDRRKELYGQVMEILHEDALRLPLPQQPDHGLRHAAHRKGLRAIPRRYPETRWREQGAAGVGRKVAADR